MDEDKPNIFFSEEDFNRLRREIENLRGENRRVRRERDDAETRCTAAQTNVAELEHRVQTKVAELEHRVRTQAWEIEDLKSEIRALKEAAEVAAKAQRTPPTKTIKAPPPASTNLIEISDDEDDVGVVRGSVAKKDSKARPEATSASEMSDIIQIQDPAKNRPQSRQIMDHVSIPRRSSQSPLKSRAWSSLQTNEEHSSQISCLRTGSPSTPGRFKRVRSISPPIDDSTLVGDDETVIASSSKRPSRDLDTPVPPTKAPKKAKLEDTKDSLKDVANIYLTNATPFPFPSTAPPNPTLLISRRFLLKQYGVLNQTFLGSFKATDGRGAVFPQPELNPFLPDKPGAPGLIFASRFEIVEEYKGMPWALFCKHTHKEKGKGIVWRYMGEYRNVHCGDLTPEQFGGQTQRVKQQWGSLLKKAKVVDTYVGIRARVALRKAGVRFTPGDETEMRERGEQVAKKGGRPLPVEAQDIVDALTRGDETIGIIKMECVSYDHALVEDMEGRYEEWVAHAGLSEDEVRRKAKTTKSKESKSKVASKSKFKSQESESDSDAYMSPESEDSSNEDEDEDGVGLLEAVRVRRREAVGRRRMVGEREERGHEPSFGFDSDSPLTELEDTDDEAEEGAKQ
ncbi:hypothetical protein R3P38DRAFT_2862457 [Favolaschia claudopus]|uniref:DUF6697 domain-containing protein n=1 Tax=Favolaschia claudopus TaxID=2862362 RepID=A0AAW0DEM0_9AGAR